MSTCGDSTRPLVPHLYGRKPCGTPPCAGPALASSRRRPPHKGSERRPYDRQEFGQNQSPLGFKGVLSIAFWIREQIWGPLIISSGMALFWFYEDDICLLLFNPRNIERRAKRSVLADRMYTAVFVIKLALISAFIIAERDTFCDPRFHICAPPSRIH